MRDFALIADALAEADARAESVVLATVVRTEGSTYRRAGARMVLRRDGTMLGAVSGGCLEADLAARVADLLDARLPRLVTYDNRSDEELVWGLGLGCNGRVDILLEPLGGEELARAARVHAWCRDVSAPVVLATVIAAEPGSGARIGDRLAVSESSGELAFGLENGPAARDLVADAWDALADRRSSVRSYGLVEVVHEIVMPPIALLVCGAGMDAVPLVRLATGLGWRVTVVDHRPGYVRADRFHGAIVRLVADDDPSDATAAADAAVVMAHHYERDRERVRALLAAGVPYVGVLGPRRRTVRMIEELGITEEDAARLYAPVGLDIGAETPDEIALAIVAEIQGVRSGRRGGPLRERSGGIHDGTPAAALTPAPAGSTCGS